jgi:DnaJ-class molecular chaperone
MNCPACNKNRKKGFVDCPDCKGKGKKDVGGILGTRYVECSHCGGSGIKICGVCKGKGTV